MKLSKLIESLGLDILNPGVSLDTEIRGGYTGDLLSDVMGHSSQGQVWITIQAHRNTIGIASLKDLAAVILVKGIKADQETLAVATEEGIPVLSSNLPSFELSGRIYSLLENQ